MELNISLRKLQKYFLSYSVIMGIVYIGSYLTRVRSYFLFHSIYVIFLLFLLGAFAVLFLDFYIEENEKRREINLKQTLYNFGLFYSLTMGVFTFFYYQGNLPQDLKSIRNILLALVAMDTIGLLILSWKEGAPFVESKSDQKILAPQNFEQNLEGVLTFMEDNAHLLYKKTYEQLYESKRSSRDLALFSAISTFIVLIPLVFNIDRYAYFINLFIIQYGVIVLFAVFFSSFLYYQISFIITKYYLTTIERHGEIKDKVYCFLSCIHKIPVKKERMRKEKFFYVYWTSMVLILISFVFFFGVIPPILRAVRLISLVILVVLALIYKRKLKLQIEQLTHVETIADIELRPLSHIQEMSQLDKNTFVKIYYPIMEGKGEIEYTKLGYN